MKENSSLKSVHNELNELRQRLDMLKGVEAELKRTTMSLKEKSSELEKLQGDLQKERDEKIDLINEEERWRKEKQAIEEKLASDNEHLKALLDAANEQIKLNQSSAEGLSTVQTFLHLPEIFTICRLSVKHFCFVLLQKS